MEEEQRHKVACASRGHWRPAEDAKLRELVARHGPQNWNLIAEKLEGRSGKSCRLRWFNQLDPRINRAAFSAEEEERLLAAHRLYGNKWALIARLFPRRTDNAVKNHWHVIMARRQREQQQHSGAHAHRRSVKPLPPPPSAASSSSSSSGLSISPPSHHHFYDKFGYSSAKEPATAAAAALQMTSGNFPFIDFLGVGAT